MEEIPAHPDYLRQRLEKVTPASAGVAPSTFANVVSLVRFALNHSGLANVPGRYRAPMGSEWERLYAKLRDYELRYRLSRLARYCTANGLTPTDVTDEVLGRFLYDLQTESMVREPRKVHRNACAAWNKAAATVAAWPQTFLNVPNYRNSYAVPWTVFPGSLRDDIARYRNRMEGNDLYNECPTLRPATVTTRMRQLHEYLSALVHQGHDPSSMKSLGDVLETRMVEDGMRFFLNRAGKRTMKHAHGVGTMLTAIAKHHGNVEEDQLKKIKTITRNVKPKHSGMTEKNKALLRQFDDPANVRKLLSLPSDVFKRLERVKNPTFKQACLAQAAIAILMLLKLPMRVNNLAALDLDHHLIRSKQGVMHVSIPAHQVKNEQDIDAVLSGECVRWIELYLTRFRSLLLRRPSSHLFPGKNGGAKTTQALHDVIAKCVKRECGLRMTPHPFRHFAAKLILEEEPGDYGTVSRVLHHKDFNTAVGFYCGPETAAAMEKLDAIIQSRLGAGGKKAKWDRRV
jgi:integrase